ncbi:hypothetical protein [Methylobacterium aquaticum]|uniref:hypothetical protein n=1 Tax=Methylobacterium aquaticum TaxID=270351 RepID=UPI0019316A41|nr:hypothetical protein [Methylobacterium aquaticum]QRE73568.1 hypothetical protein F1D61_08000 [Methylobacterium aquaticum]
MLWWKAEPIRQQALDYRNGASVSIIRAPVEREYFSLAPSSICRATFPYGGTIDLPTFEY